MQSLTDARMSAKLPIKQVAGIASPLSEKADAIHALLAELTAVVPAADEPNACLEDALELAQLLADWTADTPVALSDFGVQLGRHLQEKHIKLSPVLKVQLLFWQTFFGALEEKSQLADELLQQQQRLRIMLITMALRDQSLLSDGQHPLLQFMQTLLQQGVYWYPQSGKDGTTFLDAAVEAVESLLAAGRRSELETVEQVARSFVDLSDKQQARAQMIEQRCAEGELGMAKIHQAQAKVIALLESLHGCALPEATLRFIGTILKGELQFILINDGENAAAWKSWGVIVKRLSQIFPPLSPEEDKPVEPEPPNRQQLYRDVQIIVGLLDEHVTVSAANQQVYDDGVSELRERLFEKLRGVAVPLAPFELLTVPDELSRIGAAVSPSLLKKVANLQVGDWFLFAGSDGQLLRCKLLLRPPELTQFLFVNRSGHRVLLKSVQDFSACLATRIAQPLVQIDSVAQALTLTLAKLQSLLEKNKALAKKAKESSVEVPLEITAPSVNVVDAAVNSAEQNVAAVNGRDDIAPSAANKTPAEIEIASVDNVVSAAAQSVESSPEHHPAINRKSAAQKALQEARVLEKLEIRRERLTANTHRHEPLAEAASGKSALEQAAKLNIGAWLELPQVDSETLQRCKLVAIMRSTNTYIFTNRQGIKVAEYDLPTLAALMERSAVRIVSNGDDFEGQLSKVVLTLRRDT